MVKNYKLYKKDGFDIVQGIKWEGWNIDYLKCFLGDSLLINPSNQLYFDFVDKDMYLDIYLKNPNERIQKIDLNNIVIRDKVENRHFKIIDNYEEMEY